ncbi:MAG: glutamate synthase-related protein [Candidatus Altiarchaeota archaeon]
MKKELKNIQDTVLPKFRCEINLDKCSKCKRCATNCTYDCIRWDDQKREPYVYDTRNCVACQRCSIYCPEDAITVGIHPNSYSPHANWSEWHHRVIYENARTGRVLLTGMGNDRPQPFVFDNLVWDACQVTNPSIDALREPVETKTYLGKKLDRLDVKEGKKGFNVGDLPPNRPLFMPLIIGHMSLGSLSYNAYISMIRAVDKLGTLMGTGEGGLHVSLRPYRKNVLAEVASGRFGVGPDYLDVAALEIKIGQGAKPGHGGQLPGEKVNEMIADTRGIPVGTDALSPNPQHDIYSIEDLKTLIAALHEATDYQVPVGVKIAAVNNVPAIASGIVHAEADFITIDGFRGGTGASPRIVRDNTGIPIELAIAATDQHLTREGIRHKVTLIAGGSLRSAADLIKILALGADVGQISTSVLMAMGCTVCQQCHRGLCSWGIATGDPRLGKRVDVEWATQRIVNLFNSWHAELEEVLGIMGIDAVESFVGNRGRLRYIGPNPHEAEILGVRHAGE